VRPGGVTQEIVNVVTGDQNGLGTIHTRRTISPGKGHRCGAGCVPPTGGLTRRVTIQKRPSSLQVMLSTFGTMHHHTRSEIGPALQRNILDRPDRPAIEGGSVVWTYADVDRKSANLAAMLRAAGVGPGDIVPLLMRRSPAMVLSQVAAIRIGAAYSPVDPDVPASRLNTSLQLLSPKAIITDDPTKVPSGHKVHVIDLNTINLDVDAGRSSEWVECGPEALAYVTFTSGTTGNPKGVMIPHSGIVRLVCDADWATFTPNDRWGFVSAPAFDTSTLEVWGPLVHGGACVVQETAKPSLDELANFILDKKLTSLFLTSALFSAMTDHRIDAFQNLEQLMAGGERVSPSHARSVLQAYPNVRLINGYGPTENTTFTTCHTITLADTENINGIPIGSPINGTTIRVGDAAEEATTGELLTGGAGVALGYIKDPTLTAEKFVSINGERWYKTGDLVTMRSDGIVEYKGRLDRQVKIQGHRIELNAIESVLSTCPGVGQCIVFVAGDTAINRHLVGCYTSADSTPPSTESIVRYMQAHLALPWIPKVLHELPDMPRTTNGKIDSSAVQSMVSRKTHVATAAPDAATYELSGETEARLAEIWREIFHGASIHALSSFEQLAGTSMQALQLSAQVRRRMQRDLAPVDVIRAPVLRAQAKLIDTLRPLPAENRNVHAPLELTRMQRSILGAHALDESGCAYLVHVALRFDVAPDVATMQRAFEQLAARHPSLRLNLSDDPTATHASVAPALPQGWWHDQGEDAASVSGELSDAVLRTINRPLHHSTVGVMRVDWWRTAPHGALLVWTIQHAVIDEASIDRCLIDLDLLLGGIPVVGDVGDPFEFARFEADHTQLDAIEPWTKRFAEVCGTARPALPRAPGSGREITIDVPADLSSTFVARCRHWETTPFAPLMVLYARAVQDVFGREHAFVVTPFSRHQRHVTDGAVGCLLDLNIVEAGSRPNESVQDTLSRVHRDVAALQRNVFLPLDRVAEALNQRAVGMGDHLTNFGFTWRLDTSRALQLGNQQARLIRVPQLGARFGMTMHCWTEGSHVRCAIEFIDGEQTAAKAAEVATRFVEHLRRLCAIESGPEITRDPTFESGRTLHPASPNVMEAVRQAWIANTHTAGVLINDLSNFWAHGGNSLTALQMIAQLERQFRIQISPADFFEHPTLGRLWRLAASGGIQPGSVHVLIGSAAAEHLVVLFPGNYGSPLEQYHLATHLERELGPDHAVVIVDQEEILRRAPEGQRHEYVLATCATLFDQLGRERVTTVVGFSTGGIFALAMAAQYDEASAPEVWMLDTYKPFSAFTKAYRRVSRPVIGTLLRSPIVAKIAGAKVRDGTWVEPVYEAGTVDYARQQAAEELARTPVPPPTRTVHMIQAVRTAREQMLLVNGRTNGFARAYFSRGSVVPLDCIHIDLTRSMAGEVASLMAASIRQRMSTLSGARRSQSRAG
jgi:amino acid adenylation domain-containing protein